jgi:mxaJ protein
MSSRSRARPIALAAALGLAPAAAQPLSICAEPDNLPFSHRDGRGFEIETAALLAADLGRTLEVRYVAQRVPGFLRTTVNAGQCDAVMSVPGGFKRLATTRPWYRSRYVAVTKNDADVQVVTLDDPKLATLRIGIPSGGASTPPGLLLSRRGLLGNVRSFSALDTISLIRAVAAGDIDIAIAWGPYAGGLVSQEQLPLAISPLPNRDADLPLAFDMSIGVSADNVALRDELNAALARNAGAISGILARWRIP